MRYREGGVDRVPLAVFFLAQGETRMNSHALTRTRKSTILIPLAILLAVTACQTEAPPDSAEVAAHMSEHFGRASDLQRAVVNGNMEAIEGTANWLAEHSKLTGAPASWDPYLAEMRTAAEVAAEAPDLYTAAQATARVGSACGDCHKAHGAVVELSVGGALAEGGDAVAHMQRHVWASERLWEGLVVPSAEVWQTGAKALDEVPLVSEEVSNDQEIKTEIQLVANRVHELGAMARQALDPSLRAAAYGELLATCYRCHQATEADDI